MRSAAVIVVACLAACATSAEHENFKQVMSRQIGKAIDDPDAYPVFYRLKQVNAKPAANGNQQYEYAAGRRGDCRLFFEVEPVSLKIVRWSYEGGDRECVIPPRTPN